MADRWRSGEIITRREVLGLGPFPPPKPRPAWYHKSWLDIPVHVIEDSPEQLITYTAPLAPFHFPPGTWPTPAGLHPWHGRQGWTGHGCLMIQRPEDHYAVWHFWNGPDREFSCWYVNLQVAFERTAVGYDTQDLELDIVISPDGHWTLKDDDILEDRVREGRFTAEQVAWIRELGSDLCRRVDARDYWWDLAWSRWTPDPR